MTASPIFEEGRPDAASDDCCDLGPLDELRLAIEQVVETLNQYRAGGWPLDIAIDQIDEDVDNLEAEAATLIPVLEAQSARISFLEAAVEREVRARHGHQERPLADGTHVWQVVCSGCEWQGPSATPSGENGTWGAEVRDVAEAFATAHASHVALEVSAALGAAEPCCSAELMLRRHGYPGRKAVQRCSCGSTWVPSAEGAWRKAGAALGAPEGER